MRTITIYKNVPIFKASLGRPSGRILQLLRTIKKMEKGDMIITTSSAVNLRQQLYDLGIRIVTRFNPKTNKFHIWKEQ